MRGLFIIVIAHCILWCFFLYLTHTQYTKFSWEMAQPDKAKGQSALNTRQYPSRHFGRNIDWAALGGQTRIVFLTNKSERLSITWEHHSSCPRSFAPWDTLTSQLYLTLNPGPLTRRHANQSHPYAKSYLHNVHQDCFRPPGSAKVCNLHCQSKSRSSDVSSFVHAVYCMCDSTFVLFHSKMSDAICTREKFGKAQFLIIT